MLLDRGERLVEPPLDRLGQLPSQLLELCEAPLEVLPLGRQLGQALLLLLVLLLRERVDCTEGLTPALQTDEPLGERFLIVACCRLGAGLFQPLAGSRLLGLEPGELDVDRGGSLAGLGGAAPKLGLARRELAKRGGRVARARTARVDART